MEGSYDSHTNQGKFSMEKTIKIYKRNSLKCSGKVTWVLEQSLIMLERYDWSSGASNDGKLLLASSKKFERSSVGDNRCAIRKYNNIKIAIRDFCNRLGYLCN